MDPFPLPAIDPLDPIPLLILILATARIIRILTTDQIAQPIRDAATNRSQFTEDLIHCPWCIGFWIAIITTLSYLAAPTPSTYILLPFAVSFLASLITVLSDR